MLLIYNLLMHQVVDLLAVAVIHIVKDEFDLLSIFQMFSDITEVDKLGFAVNVGLLIFEFQNLDSREEFLARTLPAVAGVCLVLLDSPEASTIRIGHLPFLSFIIRKVSLMHLFNR